MPYIEFCGTIRYYIIPIKLDPLISFVLSFKTRLNSTYIKLCFFNSDKLQDQLTDRHKKITTNA